MKLVLIALLPLAALGCASNPPPTGDAVADASKVICTKEEPIGSHLPVTRCRTEEQRRAEQQGVADSAASTLRATPTSKGSAP